MLYIQLYLRFKCCILRNSEGIERLHYRYCFHKKIILPCLTFKFMKSMLYRIHEGTINKTSRVYHYLKTG